MSPARMTTRSMLTLMRKPKTIQAQTLMRIHQMMTMNPLQLLHHDQSRLCKLRRNKVPQPVMRLVPVLFPTVENHLLLIEVG